VLCDTGLGSCPSGAKYPRPNGTVILKPLPTGLRSMPNPCAGVPANPWCPGGPVYGYRVTGGQVRAAGTGGNTGLLAVPAAGRRQPAWSRLRPAD
jgi:hypothetical protein